MLASTVLLALLTSACDDPEVQARDVEARSAAKLPIIRVGGKDYPYIQYPEVTGKTESRGRAIFLYPITDLKNRLSALEYTPGMKMHDLFAEDMAGISGLVVRKDNQISVQFLPLSIPVGVAAGQEWRIQYAKREFVCKSGAPAGAQGAFENIKVSCKSGNHTLNFQFHRELGVTEFQDFCNFSICTYKLDAPRGLLSRSMTDFMGLPRI